MLPAMQQVRPLNIQKVVAIQNYGTSGTTLMHSLLDDHPKILGFPFLHALPLYQVWEAHLQHAELTPEKAVEVVATHMPGLFDVKLGGEPSLSEMGENQDVVLEVDKEKFSEYFTNYLQQVEKITRREFIIAAFVCYNLCWGKEFSDDSYLCYPIHGREKKYAEQLAEDFAEVKFIHMIREPVQNMGSLVKHIYHNHMRVSLFRSAVACAFSQLVLEKSMHWDRVPVECYGKRPYLPDVNGVKSRYVRLEDMHANRSATMKHVLGWLGLDDHPILEKTTFMGYLWHNRAESIRVTGVNKAVTAQKHSGFFSPFDKYRLKLLTKAEQNYFGYATLSSREQNIYTYLLPLLLLLPFKADGNLSRLTHRLRAMQQAYAPRPNPGIIVWMMTGWPMLTLPVATLHDVEPVEHPPHIRYGSLFLCLPAFLCRLVLNYVSLRWMMLEVWFSRLLPHRSHSWVKPLYDPETIIAEDA